MINKKIIHIQDLIFYDWFKRLRQEATLINAFKQNLGVKQLLDLSYFKETPNLYNEIIGHFLTYLIDFKFFSIDPAAILMLDSTISLRKQNFTETTLLWFLEDVVGVWRNLITPLVILYKLYPQADLHFGKAEFWIISYYVEAISVLNELVNLLVSLNSSFSFKEHSSFTHELGQASTLILPKSHFNSNLSKDFYALRKDNLIDAIIKPLLEADYILLFYIFLQQDDRYNFFLLDNSKDIAVKSFLMSIFSPLSLESLRFLYLNPIYTESDLKQFAKTTTEKYIRKYGKNPAEVKR